MDRFGGLNPRWQSTLGGNGNQRTMEEVPATESRENENFGHVATSDEQENRRDGGHESSSSSLRGPHSRHTPHQIEELENYFKDNPHPNERQRAVIGRKFNIEVNKVKFWFQNRRTQMKTQLERLDNAILKQENETLRLENMAMREALRTSICIKCGKQAVLPDLPNRSVKDNKLKIENSRLRDELTHLNSTVQQLLSSSATTSTAQGVTNANVIVEGGLMGRTNNSGLNPVDGYLELALKAADELMKLGSVNAPLWETNMEGGGETLNFYEYVRVFPPLLCPKPPRFASEASRASAMVSMPSLALVETLLDANQWREMFAGLIGSSTTMEVISNGTGDSRNGVLQIMNAEIQLVSILVPVRVLEFIRFSQKQAQGVWVVVDLSIDDRAEGAITRRLPSGCILHDMPNGFSRVTWIEHTEYDEYLVHHQYRQLLRPGMGLGAQKWICALFRHCDSLRVISTPTTTHMLSPSMRMSLKGLARRMTSRFCAGVCLTGGQRWDLVAQAPGSNLAWIMTRKSLDDLGEPSGIIVSATTSEWIPARHRHLFDLLLNRDLRCVWDVFCQGNAVGNMLHFPLPQDETSPNSISILSSNTLAAYGNSIMILQETSSDMTGSLIVYATMDYPTVSTLIMGGDVSSLALLPTGLCIVPGYGEPGAPGGGHEHGSMVTVGVQVLLQDVVSSNLPVETISMVNDLVSRIVRGIKDIVRSAGQQGG